MLFLLSLTLISLTSALSIPPQTPFQLSPHLRTIKRVPVTLGVMSHCPDARFCENVFNEVLDEVGGLVDMNMEYIGSINLTAPHGVTCMHGESECIENIDQLCASKYWLEDSEEDGEEREPWNNWWNFVQCLNRMPSTTGDNVKPCASSVGREWKKSSPVSQCALGKEGSLLLQASVLKTAALGIKKSCTIVINSKPVCVHDSEWKDCIIGHEAKDFAGYIREEWKKMNGVEESGEF